MIVNRDYTEATVSANVESYAGGIAMNAEMFRMIISGIYKDKRLAAAREPLFNAFDSHIEAGKHDVPIQIHSPTQLEPWFAVRDFGMGMDKDTVTKVFMIMGTSTKRENNEVVGAKGIGSKAPWAYTDMFTVTSIHGGMKTAYSAYLHKGLPRIAILSESQTDEGNGVEIKFSVEPTDVGSFRNAIKKCLTYVKSPYEINDPYVRKLIEDDAPECFYRRDVDGWIVEFYRKREGHQNVVIMGQQPYISDALKDLPPCSVTIPIGDCDVSPGREYTEEGEEDGGFSEKLKRVIKGVSDEIGKTITDALDQTKSIEEAKAFFEKQKNDWFIFRYGHKWLQDKMYEVMGCDLAATSTSYEPAYRRGSWQLDRKTNLTPMQLVFSKCVLFADKQSALKRKAVGLAKQYDVKRMYVVYPGDPGEKLATDDYFKSIFVYATSFNAPKEEKVRAARTGNIRVCVFERDGDGYEQWVDKKALSEVEYYMVKSAKNQGDRTWVGDFRESKAYVKTQFDNLGVDGDEIWLVTSTAAQYLPKDAVLVEQSTWVENTKKSYHDWVIRRNLRTTVDIKRTMRKLFGVKTLNFKPAWEKYPHRLNCWLGGEDFHSSLQATAVALKIKGRYEKQLQGLKDKAQEAYPLLKYVGFKKLNSPEFKEYRKLMDEKRGEKNV